MKKIYGILVIGLLLIGCKQKINESEITETKVEFDEELTDELAKMVVIDQLAAANAYPPESHSNLTLEEWKSFKDSIFRTHQKRVKQIFDNFGFPGYDLVGEEVLQSFG